MHCTIRTKRKKGTAARTKHARRPGGPGVQQRGSLADRSSPEAYPLAVAGTQNGTRYQRILERLIVPVNAPRLVPGRLACTLGPGAVC